VSAPESPSIEQQIAFARHNFDNLQSLIRASDTKAAAIITLIIFLAASGLQVAKDAAPYIDWHSCRFVIASTLFVVASTAFVAAFLRVLWVVQDVLRPRGTRHYHSPRPGVNLMWQDHVLAHETNVAYAETIRAATASLLLRNVTDQVFELASISKDKMAAVLEARAAIWWAFLSWIIGVVSSLLLIRWK
jgi:nitrate reductase NapE component